MKNKAVPYCGFLQQSAYGFTFASVEFLFILFFFGFVIMKTVKVAGRVWCTK